MRNTYDNCIYQGWTPQQPKRMTEAEEKQAKEELWKEYSQNILDRIEARFHIRVGWESGSIAVLTKTLYLCNTDGEIRLHHRERTGSAPVAYLRLTADGSEWRMSSEWRSNALAFADFCTWSDAGAHYPGRLEWQAQRSKLFGGKR